MITQLNGEQVVINNLQEQTKSLTSNINVARIELNTVLDKQADAIELLSILGKQIDARIETLQSLDREISSAALKSAEREAYVAVAEKELAGERELFETYKQTTRDDIALEQSTASATLSTLKSQIAQAQQDCAIAVDAQKKAESELADTQRKTSDSTAELRTAEATHAQAIEAHDVEKKALDSAIADLRTQLADLEVLVEAERQKIPGPLALLAVETEKLEEKKRNLTILLNRAKRYYEILYPGQEPIF